MRTDIAIPAGNKLKYGDIQFLDALCTYFRVRAVKVEYDGSKAKWPDCWIRMKSEVIFLRGIPTMVPVPVVTITDEWRRQPYRERCKRMTHELVGHYVFLWEHSPAMDALGFTSRPETDVVSRRIYEDFLRGRVKSAKEYLR